MRQHSARSLLDLIDEPYSLIGDADRASVTHASSPADADEQSLVFVDPQHERKQACVESTRAGVVLCDPSCQVPADTGEGRLFVLLDNPKLAFLAILRALFAPAPERGVHPSAVVHPEADISPSAYVGPLTYVGKASIGDGTVIRGNTFIYDKVTIGNNVVVEAGCVIGSEGSNFAIDAEGNRHQVPHLAGVVIEDNVEIQALNVIDRGILSDTVIGKDTKINSGCYIAHNCVIGERNLILGHSMVSGSVRVGDDCWVSPGTTIRDRIDIGADSFLGMGSLVVKPLDAGSKVMGQPARSVEAGKRLQAKLRELADGD